MARLIYTAITSLDGYVVDKEGRFDWAAPDPEVHQAVNDLERHIGTYLYGRRLYETMRVWQTLDTAGQIPAVIDFAEIWRGADKIVYSRTLAAVDTPRTRLASHFDSAEIRRLKATSEHNISIGGSVLAAEALRLGLVDEFHQFVHPIAVGGGRRVLPDDLRWRVELVDVTRFRSGVVHLHYRNHP